MANWWESAPLVEQPAQQQGNWWESAPLVEQGEATTAEKTDRLPQAYGGSVFDAATEGSHAGLMFGFDDEITAGMLAPVNAAIDWAKGDGFDMGRAYTQLQQKLDARKDARRSERPYSSIAGELAGGLAVPGVGRAAGSSVSGAGSIMSGIGKGALQGAGYGALAGAGEADPGERLAGALEGGAIGAVTGGVVGGVGSAIANRASRKAANAMAPSTDDLAQASRRLYEASEAEGVRFSGPSVERLKNKLKFAAGGINDKLRPKTSGVVDEIDRMFGSPLSLEAIDEFRQGVGLDLKTAAGSDKLRLTRMKQALDEFVERVSPQDITGGQKGIEYLGEARKMWAQHKKAEVIDNILDMADVKTGQYTQSGLANTIKTQMRQLYAGIMKGKAQGWTKEEVDLVRQMAKGGSPSSMVNFFAKFAPRGIVSIAGGQLVGSAIPVVGNFAMPIAGHVAGKAADRGAMQALETLRNAAAAGVSPAALPQVPNKLMPLIPAVTGASTANIRQ